MKVRQVHEYEVDLRVSVRMRTPMGMDDVLPDQAGDVAAGAVCRALHEALQKSDALWSGSRGVLLELSGAVVEVIEDRPAPEGEDDGQTVILTPAPAPAPGADGAQFGRSDEGVIYLDGQAHDRVPVKAGLCNKCGATRGRLHTFPCPDELCPRCRVTLECCACRVSFRPDPAPGAQAAPGKEAPAPAEYFSYFGARYPRLPYCAPFRGGACPTCGVRDGKLHESGCGLEECPRCREKMRLCHCAMQVMPAP
jgi:hypothetical protein